MGRPTLIGDFLGFVRHEKKWWMIPLVIVLVVAGLLAIFATSSPLSPFIYSLF
jgi:ethanolamine transporter EutH